MVLTALTRAPLESLSVDADDDAYKPVDETAKLLTPMPPEQWGDY